MGMIKEKMLEERLRAVEAQANQCADQADSLATRLAEALTRLRKFDPAYVAGELGEEYSPAAPSETAAETPAVDGEIIPPTSH